MAVTRNYPQLRGVISFLVVLVSASTGGGGGCAFLFALGITLVGQLYMSVIKHITGNYLN